MIIPLSLIFYVTLKAGRFPLNDIGKAIVELRNETSVKVLNCKGQENVRKYEKNIIFQGHIGNLLRNRGSYLYLAWNRLMP